MQNSPYTRKDLLACLQQVHTPHYCQEATDSFINIKQTCGTVPSNAHGAKAFKTVRQTRGFVSIIVLRTLWNVVLSSTNDNKIISFKVKCSEICCNFIYDFG